MRQLRRQSIGLLNRVKKWQWASLAAAILISGTIWGINRTDSLAGFWGLLDDEIAVVTIESDEDGQQNITIKDPSKSFWDVLGLLGVPLVLAVLGAWFQRTQQEQSERIAKEQREQDGDETREEVLQLYFDRISALLIDKNLMAVATKKEKNTAARPKGVLAQNTEQDDLLDVAIDVIRARTLSILRRFEQDSERKGSVIRFLIEADVIARLKINLSNADLRGANLIFADLRGADLRGADLGAANLSSADLRSAKLISADLREAKLISADLRGADLRSADLGAANLSSADLRSANLSSADLREAKLISADLRGADLSSAKLISADLRGADLSSADLLCADLRSANLRGADLRGADLSGAKLIGADLFYANLFHAKLIIADLSGADLFHADLRGANLNDAKLISANLNDAKLISADLRGAKLISADLRGARNATEEQLSGALLCSTKLPERIDLDPNRDCERIDEEQRAAQRESDLIPSPVRLTRP